MMVHTDKKHFRCCSCPAQFKGRENLRKHVAKFHNELLSRNASGGGDSGGSIKAATKTDEKSDDETDSCSKKEENVLNEILKM